jgi:hypothetical protein
MNEMNFTNNELGNIVVSHYKVRTIQNVCNEDSRKLRKNLNILAEIPTLHHIIKGQESEVSPLTRLETMSRTWCKRKCKGISRIERVLMIVYNTQNQWASGLCSSSRILNN